MYSIVSRSSSARPTTAHLTRRYCKSGSVCGISGHALRWSAPGMQQESRVAPIGDHLQPVRPQLVTLTAVRTLTYTELILNSLIVFRHFCGKLWPPVCAPDYGQRETRLMAGAQFPQSEEAAILPHWLPAMSGDATATQVSASPSEQGETRLVS